MNPSDEIEEEIEYENKFEEVDDLDDDQDFAITSISNQLI